ncbi:class I SAM-dependent methyltransferase [Mycobacterium sp. SMC-4]|uniref:class I SAM-dependent methyltransferase n=1 Tax=Mycobacterium sp. SMC-4 TaxID=2857059 RepID=UPI0021B4A6B0|nr:class I SAM-dependent methyltransferase [Mycobacterium sp. SMC-4]UXA19909.1 class I SAM-dependent methyltransferase [Mycobacterium sp. SMC-4]
MSDQPARPAVNHHRDHPGFSGPTGALCALVFLLTGRRPAQRAVALTAVTAADHVVDVGCGPGTAVRRAARCGARATGVDPSATMLRVGRAIPRRAGVALVQGDAEALPLADSSATVLWALATVHHWHDVEAGLAEAHRVLAPGGRLLAVERQSPPRATGFASHGWTGEQAQVFAQLCRAAGFADVAVNTDHVGRRPVWAVSASRP